MFRIRGGASGDFFFGRAGWNYMEGKQKHGWDIFNSPSAAASGPSSPTKEFCHCQGPDPRGKLVGFIGAQVGLGRPLGSATSCLMVIEGPPRGHRGGDSVHRPWTWSTRGPEGYPTAHPFCLLPVLSSTLCFFVRPVQAFCTNVADSGWLVTREGFQLLFLRCEDLARWEIVADCLGRYLAPVC